MNETIADSRSITYPLRSPDSRDEIRMIHIPKRPSRALLDMACLALLICLGACRKTPSQRVEPVRSDSTNEVGTQATSKKLFARFECGDQKVEVFDDTAESGWYVKNKYLLDNDTLAILAQQYYESVGGQIIDKRHCVQVTYSGVPVGKKSNRFLAFYSNNPTESPNGVQIVSHTGFLFQSLEDLDDSVYPDTAAWKDDSTLEAFTKDESGRIVRRKTYVYTRDGWLVSATTDTAQLQAALAK